jgi:hypothetical protein
VGSTRGGAPVAAADRAFLESAGAGLECASATGCRSGRAVVDGLGRAAARVVCTAADRRAILERACAGRLG